MCPAAFEWYHNAPLALSSNQDLHKIGCCNPGPCWGQVPPPSWPTNRPRTASTHKGARGLMKSARACQVMRSPAGGCYSHKQELNKRPPGSCQLNSMCRPLRGSQQAAPAAADTEDCRQSQVETKASWVPANLAAQCPVLPQHAYAPWTQTFQQQSTNHMASTALQLYAHMCSHACASPDGHRHQQTAPTQQASWPACAAGDYLRARWLVGMHAAFNV